MNFISQFIILTNILFFVMQSNNPNLFIKSVYCPYYILESEQYYRMVTHAFTHGDITHLFINMIVFTQLTQNYYFNYINLFNFLIYFFLIYNCLFMSISYILAYYFDYYQLFTSRSVGFSGIIFCLKYLLNMIDGDTIVNFYGLNITKKYLVFFEIVLISLMVPNSSFFGHLFGILTGVIMFYLRLV